MTDRRSLKGANKPGSEPWSKIPPEERPSSASNSLNPVIDQTAWRKAVRAEKVKFDDEAKGRYLHYLSQHGRRIVAAKQAGISMETVRLHMKWDPEFQQAFEQTLAERSEQVALQVETEAMKGFEEPIYNTKTGELLGHKKVYETPIRLAMLKRHDPEYKERSEHTVAGVVGVLVAPAQLSPQDWIAQERERNLERSEPDRDNLDAPPKALENRS